MILILILSFLLYSCVVWGVGSFVIWALGITFIFTFKHAMVIAFVLILFKNK